VCALCTENKKKKVPSGCGIQATNVTPLCCTGCSGVLQRKGHSYSKLIHVHVVSTKIISLAFYKYAVKILIQYKLWFLRYGGV
jgi:hypothetical protein